MHVEKHNSNSSACAPSVEAMLQPSIAVLAERAWALPAIAAMLSLGQESAISRDSDVHRVAFDDEGVSVMFEYGLNKYASHLLTARISKCQNIFVMPQESSGDASFAAYLTRHLCDKTRRMEAKIKAWQRKGQPEHTRLVRLVAGLVSTPVESLPMRIVRADGDLSEISEISWEVESIPDPWTAALEDSYPFGVEVMWWRRGKHPRQGHAQFFRIPVVFQHFR